MTLIGKIKESEGFRGEPYTDHLGYPTIGFGTKLPLTEDEGDLLLMHRLNKKIRFLHEAKPIVLELTDSRQDVLYEMVYQMGVSGVLKFKKMWEAIESHDFDKAATEMLDSKWARQTPNRSRRLADIMMFG